MQEEYRYVNSRVVDLKHNRTRSLEHYYCDGFRISYRNMIRITVKCIEYERKHFENALWYIKMSQRHSDAFWVTVQIILRVFNIFISGIYIKLVKSELLNTMILLSVLFSFLTFSKTYFDFYVIHIYYWYLKLDVPYWNDVYSIYSFTHTLKKIKFHYSLWGKIIWSLF